MTGYRSLLEVRIPFSEEAICFSPAETRRLIETLLKEEEAGKECHEALQLIFKGLERVVLEEAPHLVAGLPLFFYPPLSLPPFLRNLQDELKTINRLYTLLEELETWRPQLTPSSRLREQGLNPDMRPVFVGEADFFNSQSYLFSVSHHPEEASLRERLVVNLDYTDQPLHRLLDVLEKEKRPSYIVKGLPGRVTSQPPMLKLRLLHTYANLKRALAHQKQMERR